MQVSSSPKKERILDELRRLLRENEDPELLDPELLDALGRLVYEQTMARHRASTPR